VIAAISNWPAAPFVILAAVVLAVVLVVLAEHYEGDQ